ncbi:hypothetical protein [Singulisphaera sp. PoT]|uniref:hypothetical protein n=1 Tax=Singulisphaera sp. PoT TaxID=3411797 RepID=UPI003BF4C5C6
MNTRLVCRKCHVVFHMTNGGRTLFGEPQAEPVEMDSKTSHRISKIASHPGTIPDFRGPLRRIAPEKVGIAATLVVAVGIAILVLNRPGQTVADSSSLLVKKLVDDDLTYLKKIATEDTVDDVVRWFDVVHPLLVKARERWKTKSTDIRVAVMEETSKNGSSQTFVYPLAGAARDSSIKTAAEADPTLMAPVDVILHWTKDKHGKWRLDGQQTFQSLRQTSVAATLP